MRQTWCPVRPAKPGQTRETVLLSRLQKDLTSIMPDIGPKRVRWWPVAVGAVVIAGAAAAGVFLHPVWQEFQARNAISQSLDTLEPVQAQLNEFIDRTGFLPNSNLDAGLQEADSYANAHIASLRIGRSALIDHGDLW